jgi:hypothetical protein
MEEQNISNETSSELPEFPELKNTFHFFPFQKQWQATVLLILTGFLFYFGTIDNEYALNDGIMIHQNEYVLKGVKGIGKIMTKDAYDSFYKRMNAKDQLDGGRYRPLPIATFALEQEFIGSYPDGSYTYKKSDTTFNCWDLDKNNKNDAVEDLNQDGVFNEVDCQVKDAWFRHFNNIWMYILACVFLYFVLRDHLFKENQDMAFLSALIFIAHPIHSSSVANIAGRDEILSLLFISLTLLFSFQYYEGKKLSNLFWASFMFLLALFSKEYAFVLFILLPIALFVFGNLKVNFKPVILPTLIFLLLALTMVVLDEKKLNWFWWIPFVYIIATPFLFRSALSQKSLNTIMVWFFGAFLLYLGMRLHATVLVATVPDTEILNNPYVLATGEEQFCSKTLTWLKYFCLLWFPHPLSSDYSYNTIAYRHFGDPDFILSLASHIALFILGISLVVKRHALGFAISVYFLFLLIVENIFFNTGMTMGEHLLFHPSLGFAIVLAWLILKGLNKLSPGFQTKKIILFSTIALLVLLYGCKTWERNADWKNDLTLFVKDVETVPNSVLVLGNAGARWIDMCDTKYFNKKGDEITALPFSTYSVSMLQLKVSQKELADGIKAEDDIIEYTEGINNDQDLGQRELCLYKGIGYLKHAIRLHPRYVNGYLNLGLAYFKLKRERDMLYYWKIAEHLYPNNPYLKNYYIVTFNMLIQRGNEALNNGNAQQAAEDFNKAVFLDRYNPEGWYNLGGAYYKLGKKERANACWKEVLQLDPKHKGAKQAYEGTFIPIVKPAPGKNNGAEGC